MRLLILDVSGPVCGTAVMDEARVLSEHAALAPRGTAASRLLGMVDAALDETGLALADIDIVAVVVGPGSFTGVRIGVSTAKGLCHASGKPCVEVDALEAQAECICGFQGIVCPVFDARRDRVYGAAFREGERLMPDAVLAVDEYAGRLRELGGRFMFTGSGAGLYSDRLTELLGECAVFAPVQASYMRPSAAGVVALRKIKRGELTDYASVMPVYLRPPDASRNRELSEAMRRG